jgi:hypothetical protein
MKKVRYNITPGYNSQNEATLNVERRIQESDRNLDFTQEQVAYYTLRYEDGEVMLVKDDEIVYSEILVEEES